MSRYQIKLLTIVLTIFTIWMLFLYYKHDIYIWSCSSEKNGASCLLEGQLLKKQGDYKQALKYYETSCKLDYYLGCFHLGEFQLELNMTEEAKRNIKKACQNSIQQACDLKI